MDIKTIFTRWINILAGLIVEWQAHAQARKSAIVTQDNDCFAVRRSGLSEASLIGKVAIGTKIPSDMAGALRNHCVIFELAAEKIITRKITVPAQAKEFLPGIVRNQIERLSPWPPAQAVYGIEAKPNPNDAGSLNVSVPIASRSSIDAICDELTASGLSPNRIAVRTQEDSQAPLLTLWTTQGAQQQAPNLPRMIGIGLAAAIVVSTGLSLWAVYSTNAIRAEHEEVAARTAALQHQSQAGRKAQDIALLKPPQRAWALKENTAAAVLTLEDLSRALPDNAYLTELLLENTTLRIIGLTTDAPLLIAALEQSGRFSAVHFFAPTTKGQNNELYKFYIEARVEEHLGFIGD